MPNRTLPVTLPAMGESVTEGTVASWRKRVGDLVAAGETLVEVQTDKVDAEIPAPQGGRLSRILAEEGATVAVGAPIAELEIGAEDDAEAAPAAPSAPAPTPNPPMASAAGGSRPDGASVGGDAAGSMITITLPAMGESVTEGTLGSWRRAVGDRVAAGDILVEIQTDKVDAEVPAPVSGRVARLLVEPGTTVAVGTPIAEVDRIDTAAPAAVGSPLSRSAAGAPPPAPQSAPIAPAPPAGTPRSAGASDASPITRRLADRLGLDLAAVRGSGPGGAVRRRDLSEAAPATAPGNGAAGPGGPQPGRGADAVAQAPASHPAETLPFAQPVRGPQLALVQAMETSLAIPTATSFRTFDVEVLDRRRRQLNAALQEAGRATVKVSFTHLITFAVTRAAHERPSFSTSFQRVEGQPQRQQRDTVALGLAVDVERRDGTRFLLVPVVGDAHRLDFATFRARYEDLVQRARAGALTADELQGATLTVTNPGGIGTVASVPRLMAGQAAIVAVGAVGYPPGLAHLDEAAAAAVGAHRVMTVSNTYDHRILQGAESGEFLRRVEHLLAGADSFYEGIFAAFNLSAPALEALAPPHPRRPSDRTDSGPTGADGEELMYAVAAGMSLVKAFRTHGHLAAHLDPLGSDPPGDPAMDPETVRLTPELMAAVPAWMMRVEVPGRTLAEALPHLEQTYCGTIAYEIEHISSHEQRVWLRKQIESGVHRRPLAPDRQLRLFDRLATVDAFERFLRRTYLGHHTFSIEGLDALIPMLDEAIELLARDGASEVMLGMAHRGRLNVLTHVVGRPYASMLAEFESGHIEGGATAGDVKYHFGAEGTYLTTGGRPVTVAVSHNPSHLEVVDAVVEGRARAKQTRRRAHEVHQDTRIAVPFLIHGDAAFTGQGVVSETLNLQALAGYSTGGTLHVIADNQIGFTTDPSEGRSTRYASDIAKGYDLPIIHVNADDVEACLVAVRLAVAFRSTFARDSLIDLIGYRRFGHNEGDEPAYTQPLMMERIRQHPPVVRLYGETLVNRRLLAADEVEARMAQAYQRMADVHSEVTAQADSLAEPDRGRRLDHAVDHELDTAVPAATLRTLDEQLARVPEGFSMHPKLRRFFAQRPTAFQSGGKLLWAQAEALAWASLLIDGVPIRLTGQDTERGTFSQRHLVLHDAHRGTRWAPIQHLVQAKAPFELYNSPLSEVAALGFEYGYAVTAPNALVIWEAQYGDFYNNAQVIVDQFVVAGQAKWGQDARLVLLLPHGYEGSGPEHSSGRIERFLQLAAEGNIRVAVPTTAAQYFHLMRTQALTTRRRPLICFSPKSGLRLAEAQSEVTAFSEGRFRPVLEDDLAAGRLRQVRRLLLTTGKIHYELRDRAADRQGAGPALALGRLELLYPFPTDAVRSLLASYPGLEEVAWVQEEPRNMGAYTFVAERLGELLPPKVRFTYVGRPDSASPAEGAAGAHRREQDRILAEALGAAEQGGKPA